MLAAGLLAANIAPAVGHEVDFKGLKILHPYTIEPVDRLPHVLPIYMVIRNTTATPDRLIGIETNHAGYAELVNRSLPTSGSGSRVAVEFPARSQIVMGPHSAHVVLRKLTATLEGYAYFPIRLVFEKAGKVEVEVFVEDRN
jgi:copper(I)-binding protein